MTIDNDLLDRILEKRFWDKTLEDTVWTPDFCHEFLESEESLHCSSEYLASASSYMNDLKNKKKKLYIPNISSCEQKLDTVEPGVLMSHAIRYEIKKQEYLLELPEVRVKVDDKPYVTRLQNVRNNTSSNGKFEADFMREFGRALAYCYRLDISTGNICTVAMREMKWKWEVIQGFCDNAQKYKTLVRTEDYWLAEWVERAAAVCNTQQQVDILLWIYIQAATYSTRQPRICKKTLADQLGIGRPSVRNLFNKLEKNGLLNEQPEGYRNTSAGPKSEARIINLDPEQANRWMFYEKLPAIDRSKDRKETKKTRIESLKAQQALPIRKETI